ncbi:MAG: 30S ribosomal protein S8 [Candidatus Micrarchaeota archaeon]|nr:30S ribosomal protein S8 [Candidatus Micrarchaeota archaeon]MDE1804491.1 30S ribosomal protein S8 [Candidatus Micrarchaeota archaeon]
MDLLADTINTIKVNENAGLASCTVRDTKLIKSVIEVMKRSGYITGYDVIKEGKRTAIKVSLAKKINDVGIIKPRFAVGLADFQKYETRYIPSKDFGILILSTPKGIMTNREAKEQRMGGRLLAYVY